MERDNYFQTVNQFFDKNIRLSGKQMINEIFM